MRSRMQSGPIVWKNLGILILVMALLPAVGMAQGTMFVKGNNVGIRVDNPTSALHVKGTDSSTKILVHNASTTKGTRAQLELKNNGAALAKFNNTNRGTTWIFGGGNADVLLISKNGTPGNEFVVDANGNVTIRGSLTENSSRDVKKDFEPVDGRSVLSRVASLPLLSWSYQEDAQGVRHLGPMAEDFYAAFELGQNDKGLASLDTSGVALAAIQGLYAELQERDRRITELESRLSELSALVAGSSGE